MLQRKSPQIMGILNVTPDSFSDGAFYGNTKQAVDHALAMIDQGADVIDIGGESTRPGAFFVTEKEELERVLPVIKGIKKISEIPLSIDTTKPFVAQSALDLGVKIINDVSGLKEGEKMASLAKNYQASLIIMHSRGNSQTMQNLTHYQNLIEDIKNELSLSIQKALGAGLPKENIFVDPGFGFAKTFEQNVLLLKELKKINDLGYPLVVGLSRKSFIGKITGIEEPQKRLIGSVVAAFYAAMQGVSILRVHDVAQTREALTVYQSFY